MANLTGKGYFKKGHKVNVGRKWSAETNARRSASLSGHPNFNLDLKNCFSSGNVPWNKGLKTDPSVLRQWKNEYQRDWRSPEKHRAHYAVARAIKNGELKRPVFCAECGEVAKKMEGHHPSYEDPLAVRWLCTQCHGKKARPKIRRDKHGKIYE